MEEHLNTHRGPLSILNQCLKLRVYPAPCVHGFNAGCTILKVE